MDTSALIAILLDESDAAIFATMIATDGACVISSVTLLEAAIVLAGRFAGPAQWQAMDDFVADNLIEIYAHDAALTEVARQAFLRFGKGRHPAGLNFGDCASYALAKSLNCPLLFKGNDFSRTDIAAAI